MKLSVVMPVYNEEACIAVVISKWLDILVGLGVNFRIYLINDGSKDSTKTRLEQAKFDSRVMVINKPNSGHGPTILQGYRLAVTSADWVFQTDSDDEMPPDYFPILWEKRAAYGALFGVRAARRQGVGRHFISAVSRLAVRLLFGRGVIDVNTPYRLMKSGLIKGIVTKIPDDTFAPNIIISGVLAAARVSIYNHNVPHERRKTGTVSIVIWKLWKSAMKALCQTLHFRVKNSPSVLVG